MSINPNHQLTEEQIFSASLKMAPESTGTTYAVENIPREELQELSRQTTFMDIDYFLIREKCSTLMELQIIHEMFGDLRCEFSKSVFKERVYSQSVRELITFGRIGDYKISFIRKLQQENNDDFDFELSEEAVANAEVLLEAENSLYISDIQQELANIASNIREYYSFLEFANIVKEKFPSATVAIFKYGQKVDLALVKPKIVALIADARIPVEIALGRQLKLENYFISVKYSEKVRNDAFSNFLSNSICNIRINNPIVCRTFCPQAYRICVYNTFQHYKKDVDLHLTKQPGEQQNFLKHFELCINRTDEILKNLKNCIDRNELRLETYVRLTTVADLHSSIQSMKILHNTFDFCKKPLQYVKRHFNNARKFVKQLFVYCSTRNDNSPFLFLFFYDRFMSYVSSTDKITKKFLDENYGLFLPERIFDRSSKRLTTDVLQVYSISKVYYILIQIFGESKKGKLYCAYYFFEYYVLFNRQIEEKEFDLKYFVEKFGSILLEYSDAKDSSTSNISYETLTIIMQAFLQKYRRNPFLSSIIQQVISLPITSLFICKITEFLKCKNFAIVFHNVTYIIGEIKNYKDNITIANLTEFCQRYTFESFSCMLAMDRRTRSRVQNEDVEFADGLFEFYRSMQADIEHKMFNSDFIADECIIIPAFNVFASFVLMAIPDDLKMQPGVKLKKIIEFFKSLKIFFKFIYVALFKYYKSSIEMPQRMIKYIHNSVVFERFVKKDSEWAITFNRAIYFSGRFERKHGPDGIVPPFNTRFLLKSRIGKEPFRQLNTLSEFGIKNIENDTSLSNNNLNSNPLDLVFDGIESSDSGIGNNSAVLLNSENNSDDSLNFYLNYANSPSEMTIASITSNTMENDANEINEPTAVNNDTSASELPESPIISSSHLQTDNASVIENDNNFDEFHSEIKSLFDNPRQQYIADRLISDNITKDDIVQSSQLELKQHLVTFFSMGPLEASTVSTMLKRKFQ